MGIESNNRFMYDQRVIDHFEGKNTLDTAKGISPAAVGRHIQQIEGAKSDQVTQVANRALSELRTNYLTAMDSAKSELEGLYLTHHYLDATTQVRAAMTKREPPLGWFGTAAKAYTAAKQAVGFGQADELKKFEEETKKEFTEALHAVKEGLVLTPKATAQNPAESAGLRKFVTHLEVAHPENKGIIAAAVNAAANKVVGAVAGSISPSALTGADSCRQLVQDQRGTVLGDILSKIGDSYRRDLGKNLERAFVENPNNKNYFASDLQGAVTKLMGALYTAATSSPSQVLAQVCPTEASFEEAQKKLNDRIADNLSQILVPKQSPQSSPIQSPKTKNPLKALTNILKGGVVQVKNAAKTGVDNVKRECYNTLLEKGAPALIAMVTEKVVANLPMTINQETKEKIVPLLVAAMLADVTDSLAFYVNNPEATAEELMPPELNKQVGNLASDWVKWVAAN